MDFLLNYLDYIFFFYGLTFIIMAVISYLIYRRGDKLVPWNLLAVFGLLHGANEWMDMLSYPLGDISGFMYLRASLLLISFVFLIEFGRSGLKSYYPKIFSGMNIIWQYAGLVVAMMVMHACGNTNVEISSRYVIGFTGTVLATLLFIKVYSSQRNCRYYFLVAAIAMGAYALAACIIVPRDPFFLASTINYESFQQYALFPVQFLRAAIVVVLAIVFWEYFCFTKKIQHNELIEIKFGYGKWLTAAILAVLICGWILTSIISHNFDRDHREDFKMNVHAIASGIDVGKLKKLSDSLSDMETPEYKAVKTYLQGFEGDIKGIKWFYLMKLKKGRVVFTIDSSPESEIDFTPPGTEWVERNGKGGPPKEILNLFKKPEPMVFGPYSDEWGTWISAFIPVIDPETKKMYCLLGCDIDKAKWDQDLYLSRLEPIIITLLICVILVISFLLHQSSLEASVIIADSENKYRSLFNSSNDSVLILDMDGRIMEANRIASERLGYLHDELVGMKYSDIDSSEFDEFFPDRLPQIKHDGNAVFEASHLTKDKQLIPVEINANLIDYQGRSSVLCIVRDISDRKKIEGILKDRELKYRLLFNEMLTGFALHEIICDEKGIPCDYRFLEVNPAYEKLTGLRANKIIGKTVLEILPGTESRWIRDFGNVAITGKPVMIENYHRELGKWYEVRAFSHEKGKFAVVFNEITERKFAEEMLRFERDIITAMSDVSGIKDAARKVLEIMCQIEDVDSGGIYDLNQYTGDMDLVEHTGLSAEFVKAVSHYGAESYNAMLVKDGRVFFDTYEKLMLHIDSNIQREGLKALAVIPLRCDGRTIAVINLASHRQKEFMEITRRKILAVAGKLAQAYIRIRTDEALREANMFNSEIISNAGDGIAVMDKELKYQVWNHEMEKISGVPASDVLGKNALALFPGLVEQKMDQLLKRVLEGETVRAPDFKMVNRSNGSDVFARAVCVPHKNAKGEIAGVIAVISDVTARRADESRMRTLSIAMEQSPALILITDTEGRIEYVNPKFEEVTGFSYEDVKGKNPRILKSGEIPAEFYKEMWDTIKAGKEWRGQFHNRKKNGEHFWESATISPIYDEKGGIAHFIAIKEDITRQRELQGQLLQAQKMESIGRLAGGIAHDFNNVVQVINGFAEFILLKMDRDDPNRGDMEELAKAGKRAVEITNQLLVFSRRKPVNIVEVKVNDLILNLQKMFQYALGEKIRVENILFPEVSPIKADPNQVEQVLMNLVVNARDAMPDGGVIKFVTSNIHLDEDDVMSITEAQPGRFVCISVSDSGQGMTADVRDHLFEPFFTTKPKGKGTGLGLSIVYGIVKQHNGWIAVHSEPGKGTTFEIYLPAAGPAPETKPVQERPRTETRKILMKGNGERILLVEDENSVRSLTTRILKDSNYVVFPAPDAIEAIRIFNEEKGDIDLVLSDVMLPGQNGVALVEELLRRKPGLKVLMASGYTDDSIMKSLIDGKGFRMLMKPYHYNEVLLAVRENISRKSS